LAVFKNNSAAASYHGTMRVTDAWSREPQGGSIRK